MPPALRRNKSRRETPSPANGFFVVIEGRLSRAEEVYLRRGYLQRHCTLVDHARSRTPPPCPPLRLDGAISVIASALERRRFAGARRVCVRWDRRPEGTDYKFRLRWCG